MDNETRKRPAATSLCWVVAALAMVLLALSGCGGGASDDLPSAVSVDARRLLQRPTANANVSPSIGAQTFSLLGVAVTIPGGLVESDQQLTVTLRSDAALIRPIAAMQTIGVYDVTLGSQKRFDKPLVIEFPYDAAALGSDAVAGKNLWVAYWDETQQVWNRVNAQADPVRQKLVVTTTHLSYWWVHRLAGYKYVDEAWGRKVGFEVYYNPEDTNPRGMTMRDLAQETLEALGLANANYRGNYIPTPTEKGATVHAVLTNAVDSGFGRWSGQIDLKIQDLTWLGETQWSSAHQLFHVIQAMSIPIRVTGGPQWLIDGTPDFMAYKYGGGRDKISPLSTLWFEDPKFTNLGESQAAPLGNFLQYLSESKGVRVKDLWFYVTSHPEDMAGAFRDNVSLQKSRSFESVWYDFIVDSFFGPTDFLVAEGILANIDIRHSIFLDQNAESGSESFTMRANYTVTSTMIAAETCNASTARVLTVGTTANFGSSSRIELWRWNVMSEETTHIGNLDGSTRQIDKVEFRDGTFLVALAINNDTATEIPVTLTVTADRCSGPKPFTAFVEVCASFTYTSITAESRWEQGPFATVVCVQPSGSSALAWGGSSFHLAPGAIYLEGVYTDSWPPDPPLVTGVKAIRPLTGSYRTPPPPLEIQMFDAPRVVNGGIVRFKLEGAAAWGRYTIKYQPEDDCSFGYCEARTVKQIDPASVVVWATFTNY